MGQQAAKTEPAQRERDDEKCELVAQQSREYTGEGHFVTQNRGGN
jgi:hypothetical protein